MHKNKFTLVLKETSGFPYKIHSKRDYLDAFAHSICAVEAKRSIRRAG